MMMRYGYGIWMFLPILAVISIVCLVIYLVLRIGQGSNTHSNIPANRSSALDILDQRYARGEITEDEYRQIKKTLKE